jgi:hypothetical protein
MRIGDLEDLLGSYQNLDVSRGRENKHQPDGGNDSRCLNRESGSHPLVQSRPATRWMRCQPGDQAWACSNWQETRHELDTILLNLFPFGSALDVSAQRHAEKFSFPASIVAISPDHRRLTITRCHGFMVSWRRGAHPLHSLTQDKVVHIDMHATVASFMLPYSHGLYL